MRLMVSHVASLVAVLVFSFSSEAGSIGGTLSYDGPAGSGGRPGNKALSLDGDGDFVVVDSLTDLSGPEITIFYW